MTGLALQTRGEACDLYREDKTLHIGLSAAGDKTGLTDFYKEGFNVCCIQCTCLFEDGVDRARILLSSFVRNLKQPIGFRITEQGVGWDVWMGS